MNYNIVAGIDSCTLNRIIGDVYKAVYPSLFKNTITLNQLGIESVAFDITKAPQISFERAKEIKNQVEGIIKNNELKELSNLSEDDKLKVLEMASAASFGLDANVSLTINYEGGEAPTNTEAIIHINLNIQAITKEGKNFLTAHLISANLKSIPANPLLEDLLNKAFIPHFTPYFNDNILKPIEIPTLEYNSLLVSLPSTVTQNPYFLNFSALGSIQPDVPASEKWPADCVFAGVDAALMQGVVSAVNIFPLGPSTGFDWKIITGKVNAQLQTPNHFEVNKDGSISAKLPLEARAQLTIHTPWPLPNFSFGPKATSTVKLTLKPLVKNSDFYIEVKDVQIKEMSFDFGGIPGWLNTIFSPLRAGLGIALNTALQPIIKAALLAIPAIKIFTLPTIPITLADKTIEVKLNSAKTTAQNSLLMVNTQVAVSAKQAEKDRVALNV